MIKNRPGNNKYLKKFNQSAVLDLIRINGALSRADLSAMTGLTPTAIGVITGALLEKGYIHETGTGESSGGRKPVILELKPRCFYSIGIDLDVGCLNAVLIDIKGEIINEVSRELEPDIDFERTASMIEDTVYGFMESFSINRSKLLGVGISVPGMVDVLNNRIVFAPNMNFKDIKIEAFLKKLEGIPIYIENEAMASAIYENWIGICKGIKDFVCINVKSGIGAGIFTGGMPYRGTGGCAGEIGHICVDEDGPSCGCGNYGCLETLASTTRIVNRCKKLVRQGAATSLNEISNIDAIDIRMIAEAARNGDEVSRNILAESGRYIGIAAAYVVNMLNPSMIVLGKEFSIYSDVAMEHVKKALNIRSLKVSASNLRIEASGAGEKSSVTGASVIPLKALFGI